MRQASPKDVPQLVALMTDFYAETSTPLDRTRAADAFAGLLADDRLGNVWLIQAGTRDVGYVVVTFCHSMEFGGKMVSWTICSSKLHFVARAWARRRWRK